jgi:hypothetical protein
MMVNDRVNLFKIKAARGSRSVGCILNLGDKCSSIWYRGSLGEQEKILRIWGASIARPNSELVGHEESGKCKIIL